MGKHDTPIDVHLRPTRTQLAEVGWHQLEGGAWESLYPFTTPAAAHDFLRQAQDLVTANGWPMQLSIEGCTLRAELRPGPHGLTSRHVQAIQSLHRLYGGEGAV